MVTDIDFKKCGHVFNEDAVLYERARPGYPEEMIDALLAFSGVGPPASVLDIGTGTGKALAPFYSRGFCVTGIDPGDNLLTIARANYPKGEFELTKLEDWEPRERHFDLVVSGQAFHWVPVEVSYRKSAALLRPGGTLALFWNNMPPQRYVHPIFREFEPVYELYVTKHLARHDPITPERYESEVQNRRTEFDAYGFFEPCKLMRFSWERSLTTDEYFAVLNTYPNHITMETDTKRAVFAELREIISRHGGMVPQPYETVLYMAKRLP